MCKYPLHLVLAAGALVPAAHAQFEDHSVALINDPKSHGQVGDNLLSLNEVILLNKRALTESQLSPAERAQLLGFGGDISSGDIDYNVVPKITVERDLDTIDDLPHGLVLSGSNGQPTIDFQGTRGFIVDSSFADFRGLVLENTATAITLTQNDALYGSIIEQVVFHNISGTGMKVLLPKDNGNTRIDFTDCVFENVPTAIEIFDSGHSRVGSLLFDGVRIQGGSSGVALHVGAGGLLNVTIDRTQILGTGSAFAIDRPTSADTRQVALSSLHYTASGGQLGLSFEGHSGVPDTVTLRMADLSGQSQALRIGPLGGDQNVVIEDGRLDGSVDLAAGGAGSGLDLANLRMRNGSLKLGASGATVRLADTILDGIAVDTQGSSPVAIDASRFVGGSLQAAAGAPLTVSGSFLGGASRGANVTVTGALPAAQLGSCDASPLEPSIGTPVTLTTDLPLGLAGTWLFSLAETLPYIGPRPLHTYLWLSYMVPLPFVARGQSQLQVPIPNNPFLIDWDFVVQLAVLPDPGVNAPPLSLPPGRRFVVKP